MPQEIEKTQIQLSLDQNTVVEIAMADKVKESNNWRFVPAYTRIGRTGMTGSRIQGLNMLKILKNCSGSGGWLFWSLVEKRNVKTNVALLKNADLTRTEQKRLRRAYTELHNLDLVRRIRQNHYLINPKALLPTNETYNTVWTNWEKAA